MTHGVCSLRIAVFLGLLLVASTFSAGCASLDGVLNRPGASIKGVRFGEMSLEALTLHFDIEVDNPYSVPLPLAHVDYALATDAQPWLQGKADLQGTVPAQGSKVVSLPVQVLFVEALGALGTFRPGQVVPYQAEMGLSVDAPVVGPLRLPLKKAGRVPIPAVPEIKVAEIRWDDLTLDRAGGTIVMEVTNRNEFPVDVTKMSYGLSLGGVQVAQSSLARGATFAARGGSDVLTIPVSFSPKSLGLAAWKVIAGKGAGYELTGTMDAGTPFGPISMPIRSAGRTLLRRSGP